MENSEKNSRKEKQGTVVSNKMDKTVIVRVDHTLRHPLYKKIVKRSKKFYAHHEGTPLEIGDVVTIVETRPLSKLKRWRVASTVKSVGVNKQ